MEIIPPETGLVPSLTYRYSNGVLLQVEWKLDPAKHAIPRGWDPNEALQNFGALYIGDEGWIHVGRQGYLRSYPAEIAAGPPGEFDRARPVPDHHRNWLDCIRSRERPACDVAIGGGSTIVAPPGGHRPPAAAGPRVGSGPGGVHRRRRGEPPAIPGHARALDDLMTGSSCLPMPSPRCSPVASFLDPGRAREDAEEGRAPNLDLRFGIMKGGKRALERRVS